MNEHHPLRDEPAHSDAIFHVDASEKRSQSPSVPNDHELIRDSVFNEPALPASANPGLYSAWLNARRAENSRTGDLLITAVAAIAGGPAAFIGVWFVNQQSWSGYLYLILFGPVMEELLKMSGLVFLLELKPYRVFSAWQLTIGGLIAGLAFAVCDGIVRYGAAAVHGAPDGDTFVQFALTALPWSISVHMICSGIASWGLVVAWRRHLRGGLGFDLSHSFVWLFVAMSLHGAYNTFILVSETLVR